jgi:hypothetical protein
MPSLGLYTAKRTGITAEILTVRLNGDPCYTCEIRGKVYRMTEAEFKEKWEKHKPKADNKQEVLKL